PPPGHLGVATTPVHSPRRLERPVPDIAGFLAEDGSEQSLLGRQIGFTLGRDFPDQDVPRLDAGADPDDSLLVQVLDRFFAHVRDLAGDFLGPALRVPYL